MNRIAFFSALLVGLGAAVGLLISSELAEPADPVRQLDKTKLTALQKERVDVLRQALQQAEESYRHGVGPYTSIPRITTNLMNAELDIAADRAARIAVRERMVDHLKAVESTLTEQVKAAAVGTTDLLEAKAARLQAEIELLRETADGK